MVRLYGVNDGRLSSGQLKCRIVWIGTGSLNMEQCMAKKAKLEEIIAKLGWRASSKWFTPNVRIGFGFERRQADNLP